MGKLQRRTDRNAPRRALRRLHHHRPEPVPRRAGGTARITGSADGPQRSDSLQSLTSPVYICVMSVVPTIDLDRDPAVAGNEFDAVCREVGFFQIVNHGFSSDVTDAAWDAATAFFDLPLVDRMSVARPSGGYPYGYIPMAEETLTRSAGGHGAPDLKEVFNVGPVDPPLRPVE